MANIKVSELPTATEFNDDDYVMIVQSNTNKKITKENMYKNYIYSMTETTIGKWIDDKPIYRMVFVGTSSSNNISINIANLNADDIINVSGWVKSRFDNWWSINNHYPSEPDYDTSVNYTDNATFSVNCGSYYSQPEYRIVLEYTKTTD